MINYIKKLPIINAAKKVKSLFLLKIIDCLIG